MAKAIWVAQELKLHQQLPQRRYAISGAIFGFSRSVFYIKANPAVSRNFPGRFPSVLQTALWPFLKFPAAAGGRKEKGRFQPLPLLLASQDVNAILSVHLFHVVPARDTPRVDSCFIGNVFALDGIVGDAHPLPHCFLFAEVEPGFCFNP